MSVCENQWLRSVANLLGPASTKFHLMWTLHLTRTTFGNWLVDGRDRGMSVLSYFVPCFVLLVYKHVWFALSNRYPPRLPLRKPHTPRVLLPTERFLTAAMVILAAPDLSSLHAGLTEAKVESRDLHCSLIQQPIPISNLSDQRREESSSPVIPSIGSRSLLLLTVNGFLLIRSSHSASARLLNSSPPATIPSIP